MANILSGLVLVNGTDIWTNTACSWWKTGAGAWRT